MIKSSWNQIIFYMAMIIESSTGQNLLGKGLVNIEK